MAVMSRFARSQDTLFALAGDTGGKALLDNNDLDRGIVNAQHADSDYYILGYYTTNTAVNGKFRKVVVSLVPPQQAADLDFRHGYFGEKEWGKFTTADKERQLEDALMQGDPWVDLTVAVEINYFQLNKAEYYVPVFVKVLDARSSWQDEGAPTIRISTWWERSRTITAGTTVSNIRDHFDTKLSDATATEWAQATDCVLVRLHAIAGQVHHQSAGAGRRDGADWDVPDQLCDSESEQGDEAGGDQLGCAFGPAAAVRKRDL